MEQAVTFLLAYQSVGSDGFLHAVANAHESQWAVQDPTDDIAADQALFPAVISAATLLNTDSSRWSQLRDGREPRSSLTRGLAQSNLLFTCSTRSQRRRPRPLVPTPGAAT